ncbi:14134_t:CDS:2 [Acaulospora colombiana]|uniref:14134_t:CDS:1 n=1 Tax=Acaulospora colombiana TaxID=27376 RepID=A0ACA9L1V0_9GLOM|nr:14134_t:CDS:2 [Acaulospora colombiana]
MGMSLDGMVLSADLGGSSKYSNVWDFLDTGGEKLLLEAWTPSLEDFNLSEKSPIQCTLNNQLRTDTDKGI